MFFSLPGSPKRSVAHEVCSSEIWSWKPPEGFTLVPYSSLCSGWEPRFLSVTEKNKSTYRVLSTLGRSVCLYCWLNSYSHFFSFPYLVEIPARENLIFSGWAEKALSVHLFRVPSQTNTAAPVYLFQIWLLNCDNFVAITNLQKRIHHTCTTWLCCLDGALSLQLYRVICRDLCF